jgi:hypothetical protein
MQRALGEMQRFTDKLIEIDASPEVCEAWQDFIDEFTKTSIEAVSPAAHENN